MEFGLQTTGSYAEVLSSARWAEQQGLAAFAVPDHYLQAAGGGRLNDPVYDAFALMAGLARETTRIRLSVLVTPVTFRHPAVIGKNALTIDDMSGGRFSLGVGTGWMEREHEVFGLPFPPRSERFEQMEEALAYLRVMFAPGDSGFVGQHYALETIEVGPSAGEGLEIVVGGTGASKTPTLAGRYADEFNVYPGTRESMEQRIGLAHEAATVAGRDPGGLRLSSSGLVVVGNDEADYRRRLHAVAVELGRDVADLEGHFSARNTPRGTAAQVTKTLAMMAGVGITRFYVQSLGTSAVMPVAEVFDLISG